MFKLNPRVDDRPDKIAYYHNGIKLEIVDFVNNLKLDRTKTVELDNQIKQEFKSIIDFLV